MKQCNNLHFQKYFDQLKFFINQTSGIDDSSWEKLFTISEVWQASSGETLLEYQEIESSVRFLCKGIVKCVDHCNEQSFVYDFRVAPIILSETVSFFNETPSVIALEACSDCTFISWPRKDFLKIVYLNPKIAEFAVRGVSNYLGMMHYKMFLHRTLSAKDRYKQFLKEFPTVALEIRLGDIASYIGVELPSLSRIRSTVEWNDGESKLEALSNELMVLHGR